MPVIYRQMILNDISLFTSQPKAKFYDELFMELDLAAVITQKPNLRLSLKASLRAA